MDTKNITDFIVKGINEKKQSQQIIVVTHNPNIVVNTNSEQVIHMEFAGGEINASHSGALVLEYAAKVYFNALFGLDFTRTEDNNINAALNYGYSIILSTFTREIVANGYITQLGLFHDNMFNQFNLASDLMEPFRVLVDREVKQMKLDSFEHDEKMQLVNILNQEVSIDGRIQYVNNAIKIYCKSVFDALNDDDSSLVRFYRFEL